MPDGWQPKKPWWEGIPEIEQLETRRAKLSTVLPQASWMSAPRRGTEISSRPTKMGLDQQKLLESDMEGANWSYQEAMRNALFGMGALRGIKNPNYGKWVDYLPADQLGAEIEAERARTATYGSMSTAQGLDKMYQPEYARIISQLDPYLDDPQVADAYQQLQQMASSPVTGEIQQVAKLQQIRALAGRAREGADYKVRTAEGEHLKRIFPAFWDDYVKSVGGAGEGDETFEEQLPGGYAQYLAGRPEIKQPSEGLAREFPELEEEFAKLNLNIPFFMWAKGNEDVWRMIEEYRAEQARPRNVRTPQWAMKR